jgi:beta-glucosidase
VLIQIIITAKGVGKSKGWADAYEAAAIMVTTMTNEEKANITTGATHPKNGCAGWAPAVARVGFPGMCMQGSGSGLRPTELVTAYAAPISIAASWNDDLAFRTGFYRGLEYESKGVNVALEPVCGPIGRIAENGRNWEGYGADPYLTGQMVYQTIKGIQDRGTVSACVKHFIAYEQETNRVPIGYNESVSSNVDDKTMHELYLWPFMDAMKAESGSVMCAYNRVNNSYACQNSKTLNGLLKTELGFEGFVMSDWAALHAGYEAADAGLDMVMPDSGGFWGTNLSLAVTNGSFAQQRLDDMATRIVAVWKKFGSIPNPGHGDPSTVDWTLPHNHTNAMKHTSQKTIFQGALEGHVLVKNINNALPLNKPTVLSLFGYDALPPAVVDPVSSVEWKFGYEALNTSSAEAQLYISGYWSNGSNIWPDGPRAGYKGTLITGGGSSTSNPPWIVSPYAAFVQQAREDLTMLSWNFQDQNPGVMGSSDACIVFINEYASEGFDRGGLADPWSDKLVINVANKCNNTMVVIHNAGIRVVDAWIDHPNITAVILAHLPGQESGNTLVELMYGKTSPSGRLPYTIPRRESDFGDLLYPTHADSTSNYHTQGRPSKCPHYNDRRVNPPLTQYFL